MIFFHVNPLSTGSYGRHLTVWHKTGRHVSFSLNFSQLSNVPRPPCRSLAHHTPGSFINFKPIRMIFSLFVVFYFISQSHALPTDCASMQDLKEMKQIENVTQLLPQVLVRCVFLKRVGW